MLSVISSIVRLPLEFVGLVSKDDVTPEEEAELLRRLNEKLRDDVSVFKELKGFVTQLSNNSMELDHKWVYQLDINDTFSVGDRVSYKVYKTSKNFVIKDVLLLSEKEHIVSKEVFGTICKVDKNHFQIDRGFAFSFPEVRSDFLPVLHDFVTLKGDYPKEKDDPEAFDLDYSYFKAKQVSPTNSKLVTGVITSFNPVTMVGVIGKDVVFHQNVCDKFVPKVGDHVMSNAIEGRYDGDFKWRAVNVSLNDVKESRANHFFTVAPVPKFCMVLGETKIVDLCLSNHGKTPCTIERSSVWSDSKTSTKSAFLDMKDERVILPQTTLTWPVNITATKFGINQVKFKWQLLYRGKSQVINTRFSYEVVDSKEDNVSQEVIKPQIFVPGQSRSRKPVFRRVPMKDYILPDDIREVAQRESNYNGMIEWQMALQRVKPSLVEGLSTKTYDDWMHTLLFLEELANEERYEKLETKGHLYRFRGYITYSFPAESEYSKVVAGDTMTVCKPWEPTKLYEGKVWEASPSQLFCKFNQEFENSMRDGALYNLKFRMNRTPYRRQHQAVDIVLKNLGPEWLFPAVAWDETPAIESGLKDDSFRLINSRLNNEQKCAVKNIMACKNLPLPYVIYGPPGTGKTMTVIELILQLYRSNPSCRILVGAPTNSAVDTLGCRLLDYGILDKEHMIRLSSYNALSQGIIATQLMDIAFLPSIGDPSFDPLLPDDRDKIPTVYLSDLGKQKITIGTLSTLSILNSAGLGKGFFTHVIIDEAGQCHEPDTLLPIALVDPQVTQLVLAGDPMQLGPTIESRLAQMYQFKKSFLDRLTSTFLYSKRLDAYQSTYGYNPRLVTRLVYNYRSLPKIVDLVGAAFYDGDLLPVIPIHGSRESDVLRKIEINGHSLATQMDSLVFINVDTLDDQIDGNFSWFNTGEIMQVLTVLNSLYAVGISPDDIGVITPYSLQVRKIYELLDSLKLFSPKVGSVEEFQGQERDIIILSLVRNNRGQSRKLSSFVTDSQRINVALSRARLLNVIIGHKNTLTVSPMWTDIISKCHVIYASSNQP